MSQFYDQASLVMVPSGYKAGKVYSQKPLSTDGELTFTRNSNATRVNADGLVEKVRTNLALYSNDFSNAAWLKSGSTVTAGYSDPNGGTNAFKVDISAGGNHYLYQGITMPAGTKTVSCWIKADSAISIGFSVGGSTPNAINLTTSWTRFSFVTTDTSGGVFFGNYFGPTPAQEAKTFYVYQSQLEVSDFGPTQYIPTTSAAVSVGPTANVPRLNYSNGCPSLLLEPQRTNLALYSEQFDNATGWALYNSATITANSTISPDGYQNADTLNFGGSHSSQVYSNVGGSTGTYSFSVYAKSSTGKKFRFKIATPSGDTYSSDFTTTSEWQRFTFNHTDQIFHMAISNQLAGGVGSIQIWGAQMELGSYASSYIGPTLGASVTRLADALGSKDITTVGITTSFSMFFDIPESKINVADFNIWLTNAWVIYGTTFVIPLVSGAAYPTALASTSKFCITYDGTNAYVFQNGVKYGPYLADANWANATNLNFNIANSLAIKQILISPSVFTEAQCIELTTL